MRLALRSPALVLAVLLTPALARAAWLPGGNRIGDAADYGFVAAASGPERVVVAWVRPLASGSLEVRAQAWTAEGDLATGWPSAGVLVGQLPGVSGWVAICEDGAGGAFVAWAKPEGYGSIAYVQHVSAGGSLAAGWAAEGLRLSESSSAWPAVTHDGAGGVLIGWLEHDGPPRYGYHARVKNIDAAGASAPGWPVEGLVIPNVYDVSLAVDGKGHVFVSTAEHEQGAPDRMRVLRLDRSAAPDPPWPQTGVLIPNVSPAQMRLFPDGAGGVFAGWSQHLICFDYCPPIPTRRAARLLGDGTLDDGWVSSPRAYSNAPDRTGGMLLGLVRDGRPSALRLDASGAAMPGWAIDGNASMTEIVDPWGVLVAGDGEGGAFVAWRDNRTGDERLYASRLDASGRLAHGWPLTGSLVGAARGPSNAQLVTLGGDVVIALWDDWTSSETTGYLMALRPGEPGPLAPLRPVQGDVGFGVVQVRPNPANGPIAAIVELQNEGPAKLDLVDAVGRVLESQDFSFQWQARGAVHFNRARALPAGVYWLRLTQGRRLASRKVVVLE